MQRHRAKTETVSYLRSQACCFCGFFPKKLMQVHLHQFLGSVPVFHAIEAGVGHWAQTGKTTLTGWAGEHWGGVWWWVQTQVQPHSRVWALWIWIGTVNSHFGPLLGSAVPQRAKGAQHLEATNSMQHTNCHISAVSETLFVPMSVWVLTIYCPWILQRFSKSTESVGCHCGVLHLPSKTFFR